MRFAVVLAAFLCSRTPVLDAQAMTTSTPAPVLTLAGVLLFVRAEHPLIRAAEARIHAAEGTRVTAGRLGNPIVSYQVDNAAFPTAAAVAGIDRETMAMVTVPLEPFYQRGARVTQANANVRAAIAEAESERQRTALGAAHAFYRVALARVAVATNRDLSAWLDTVVTYNRARVKEGVTAEADLLRSTLERDRAAAEATMAEVELYQARAQLASYLPVAASNSMPMVARDEVPLALPAVVFPRTGLRPGVRASRERAAAADAAVSTERRMLFREIGATLGSKRTMGTTSMIAGVSLPVPLFNANSGEILRAGAERDAARFDLANAERVASADLTGAEEGARLLTERSLRLQSGGSDNFLARADEARRIALGAYREGAMPLLQVIDVARTWGEVRMTYYRTLYAQHESVLALIVARGGDLFSDIPSPATFDPAR